ncbi:MAG: FAD-binding oxidoreductase [Pseudorhodobacter sp.]|nr:FAD-binding oxidoreductase [Pseudorhodobacter sp.]
MTLLSDLTTLLGPTNVVTGPDLARYTSDWTTHYTASPLAVARPGSTAEVAAVVKLAARHNTPIVPSSGRTGLVGGSMTTGGLMVTVERLNKIREVRPATRIAIVEAGVILQRLHEAAEAQNLYFPLWFGARGSAMIGGVLSTNAGGSNVLRYGSTRALCLGLEVVLPDGRILNLMSELHKNNSGYDLRQLFIGAEGTLGIITAAVMKLVPRPRAYATATLAARSLPDALQLLNRLQAASGGAVEAFEYMPATYMQRLAEQRPDIRLPFDRRYDTNILVEIGATAPRDAEPGPDGTIPVVALLEQTLSDMIDEGAVLDAEIAQTEAQRLAMWKRRELAAEITVARQPAIDTDVALPLDLVPEFYDRIHARLPAIDPGAETLSVCHLGDGNVHFHVRPPAGSGEEWLDGEGKAASAFVHDLVTAAGGTISAEHGIGQMKIGELQRLGSPARLSAMRAIKAALDPMGILNPGKLLPPA